VVESLEVESLASHSCNLQSSKQEGPMKVDIVEKK